MRENASRMRRVALRTAAAAIAIAVGTDAARSDRLVCGYTSLRFALFCLCASNAIALVVLNALCDRSKCAKQL